MKQLLIILLFINTSVFAQEITKYFPIPENETIEISLDSLIKNPSKYNDKLIKVSGYLNTEFEEMSIFVDSSDFDNKNWDKAILINIKHTYQLDSRKKYATIIGKYQFSENLKGNWKNGIMSKVYEANIHKTFITNAAKKIKKDILELETEIKLSYTKHNQDKIRRLVCLSNIYPKKRNNLYFITQEDILKWKTWYEKNKINITSIKSDNPMIVIEDNGKYRSEKCNLYSR